MADVLTDKHLARLETVIAVTSRWHPWISLHQSELVAWLNRDKAQRAEIANLRGIVRMNLDMILEEAEAKLCPTNLA